MRDRGKAVEVSNGGNWFADYSSSSDLPCRKHPSSSSVGICAYCLKDRLIKLVCSDCGEQRLSSCSCSDVSSSNRNSCTIEVGSVGRISFLIENEKGEIQNLISKSRSEDKKESIFPLQRSRSSSTDVKRRGLWKLAKLFRKKKEKDCGILEKNSYGFEEKGEMWVFDCNVGMTRSRSVCGARKSGFDGSECGRLNRERKSGFDGLENSRVSSARKSGFDESDFSRSSGARKSGFDGLECGRFSGARKSGFDESDFSRSSGARKSGFEGLECGRLSGARRSGFDGSDCGRSSGARKSGFGGEERDDLSVVSEGGFKGRKSGFSELESCFNGGNKRGSGVSVSEGRFDCGEDSGFIDLNLGFSSELKGEFSGLKMGHRSVSTSGYGGLKSVNVSEYESSSFRYLRGNEIINGGNSCRTVVNDDGIKKCRKSLKVWKWIFRPPSSLKMATKEDEEATVKQMN